MWFKYIFLFKIHCILLPVIHVFDLPTGLIVRSSADNTVTKLTHKMTVSNIALSQTGLINERQLALLDYNRDLYVVTVKDTKPKFVKLGKILIIILSRDILHIDNKIELSTVFDVKVYHCILWLFLPGSQILSIAWSYETELLVGLRASSVVAWCCPRAATQPDWLALTTVSKDVAWVNDFQAYIPATLAPVTPFHFYGLLKFLDIQTEIWEGATCHRFPSVRKYFKTFLSIHRQYFYTIFNKFMAWWRKVFKFLLLSAEFRFHHSWIFWTEGDMVYLQGFRKKSNHFSRRRWSGSHLPWKRLHFTSIDCQFSRKTFKTRFC